MIEEVTMRPLDALTQDARYAIRILRQNPGFASIAIVSLALGIGANTAIFTLIDTVLLRSLPVRDPQQLVAFALNPDKPSVGFSNPDYEFIRDHNKSFAGVMAYGGGGSGVAFEVPDEGAHATAQLVSNLMVSGNYFDVLGVTPAIGRLFTRDDNLKEDSHPWVVLDYGFWQRRFGGDPSIAGRRITLNGSPFNVIGVSRSGFTGAVVGNHPDMYTPIMMYREIQRGAREWNTRHQWWLTIIARLKPGVSMQHAKPEADLLWKQILANDPESKPPAAYDKDYAQRNRGTLVEASGGYTYLRSQVQKPLMVLMIVVALVLLIACANVANLLLARATVRQREIAIRLAVGAARGRLIAQLVIETLMMAVLGGIVGIGVAWWGVRVLLTFFPKRAIPLQFDLTPDWRLLAFSFGICLIVGLLCGIAPAIQTTRPDLTSALKNEFAAAGRIRFDLRRALVVLQVAASLLLLIGAGLFVRSLSNLRSLDPGFVRESVLIIQTNPMALGYKSQPIREYYDRLIDRLRAVPTVRVASLADITPLAGSRWNTSITVEGYTRRADEKPWIDMNAVSTGYFATMGTPILAGRDFRSQDNPAFSPDPKPPTKGSRDTEPLPPPPPVAIVNQAFANQFFPHQSALGRHFSQDEKFDMAKSFEIVGVVKDANYFDIRKQVEPMIYVPIWRFGANGATICIRTSGRPESAANAVRREMTNVDSAVPILQTTTLEDQFDNTIAQERTVSTLSGFFGSLAVLLAAMGLYGVMAYSVTRRYREIGIRMALGAQPGGVLWLVLRDTAWMIGIGALIGLPVAFALTRLVESFLYGLTPQDPLSIALATIGLIAVTGLAGYLPAHRATHVDPLIALRHE
jgi:predicted permease